MIFFQGEERDHETELLNIFAESETATSSIAEDCFRIYQITTGHFCIIFQSKFSKIHYIILHIIIIPAKLEYKIIVETL